MKITGSGIVAVTAGPQLTLASEQSLREAAKEHVARESGADVDDLEIVNEAMASWSTLEERYYHAKVYDVSEREIHGALLDGEKNPIDRDALHEREREACRAKYGKLDRKLYERIADADDDETFEVGIWLEGIDYSAAREAVGFDLKPDTPELRRQLSDEYLDRIGRKTEAFAETIRGHEGVTVLATDRGSTFVEAEVTATALDAVEQYGEVRKIFHIDREIRLELEDTTKTHRTYWDNEGSFNASGYPVGQGETKPDSTYYVNIGGTNWTRDYSDPDNDTSGHSQAVMECMASWDDDHPGTGHNADVYHADEILVDFDNKMEWFYDNFVCAVNFSWGVGDRDRTMGKWDFRFGQQAYHRYLNMVKSAGNIGDSNDDGEPDKFDVTSPGLGFNTTTVGNTDNKNNSNWSDDEIAGGSAYESPYSRHADPTYDDFPHTKPEVSAVGKGNELPSGGNPSGTSVAAPGVTGMYAVLSSLCDGYGVYDVRFYPSVAKAIMMAAARNDAGSFDDKMGAGTISAWAAEDIIADETYLEDDFQESNTSQTYSADLSSGAEVRVALTWLTNVENSEFSDNKDAQSDLDLDLNVVDPDGTTVEGSWNYDRGYEFLKFTTSTSGTFEFEVDNFRWDAAETSRNIGLAWHAQ
jgi:hypothetical protein